MKEQERLAATFDGTYMLRALLESLGKSMSLGSTVLYLFKKASTFIDVLCCDPLCPDKQNPGDIYWLYDTYEGDWPVFECRSKNRRLKKNGNECKWQIYSDSSSTASLQALLPFEDLEQNKALILSGDISFKIKDNMIQILNDVQAFLKEEIVKSFDSIDFSGNISQEIEDAFESQESDNFGMFLEQLVSTQFRDLSVVASSVLRKSGWIVRYASCYYLLQIKNVLGILLQENGEGKFRRIISRSNRKGLSRLFKDVCMILETRKLKEKDPNVKHAFQTFLFAERAVKFWQGNYMSDEKQLECDDKAIDDLLDKIQNEPDKFERQKLSAQIRELEKLRPNVTLDDLRHSMNHHFMRSSILSNNSTVENMLSDVQKELNEEFKP